MNAQAVCVSSPADTQANTGLTGSATLVSASTAFRLILLQSSGLQQCWRDEEDEGGTKQSPRQGRWLLGESGGLAGIFA